MSENPIFSVRMLVALVAVGVIAFAGLVFVSLVAPEFKVQNSRGADAFSVSAIGHKGLVETLRASGRTVLVSRSDSAMKAGRENLLMVVEPDSSKRLRDFLPSTRPAGSTLIVLPKWSAAPHPDTSRWVGRGVPLPVGEVSGIAAVLGNGLRVRRDIAARDVDATIFTSAPGINVENLQLLAINPQLRPMVAVGNGVLLAKVRNRFNPTYVLSDPDILNNLGLKHDANARLTAMILNDLAGQHGGFVFDEEIHGFGQRPDLWRNLLSPPLVAPTLAVAMALLVLVLAGVKRFGPAMKARPAHAAGRGTLYDVTAMLLGQRGDYRLLAREYAAMTMRVMSEEMRLSRRLTAEQRVRHIEEIGRRRGVEGDLRGMLAGLGYFGAAGTGRRVEAVVLAARLNQWSKEVLHGIR